eukprot:TRINITY_DN2425_c0_g1_i5.p1 TRINITY_DN2425_c0_g1~~TRINITY_DN2425_c0_g1_i5.p1  ORF type:complete len:1329 (-),score=337.78 TRINITY_DN2425_c0_g1_i5:666-4652(-)
MSSWSSWAGQSATESPKPPQGLPPVGLRAKIATLRQQGVKRPSDTGSFSPLKQEPVKQEPVESPADNSARQAKIRALAEKIRSESRQSREESAQQKKQQEADKQAALTEQSKKKVEEELLRVENLIPGLEEKVVSAEDETERIAILAAPLSMEAVEDLKEVQAQAIRDTERAVKATKIHLDGAVRELEKIKREVQAIQGGAGKTKLVAELAKLDERLQAARAKVDEHKNVRKDHEAATQAEKTLAELSGRLAGVEMECEKAVMMAEPIAKVLGSDLQELGAADIREAKEALRVAQATLAPTLRLIIGKSAGLKGPVLQKMLDLQSRAEESKNQLERAQQTVEEAQSGAAAQPILKQAKERLAAVEEILERMRETEAPFLMGIETLPADESTEALDKMDTAAKLAMSALLDSNKYVSLKIVEVGRLSEATASSARQELEKVKKQIDDHVQRVRKFQAEASKRRRVHLVVGIKHSVEVAEAAIQKLQELSGELRKATAENLAEALEKARAADVEAQSAVTAARREVQDKQQDMRQQEGGQAETLKGDSEVLRSKVRVNSMEAELNKFKRLAGEADEKIKVQKSLHDIFQVLASADADIQRLSEASKHWLANPKPPAEDEQAVTAVQGTLSGATSQVEKKIQAARGLELKELKTVLGRLQKAQKALDTVKEAVRERNRSESKGLVQEASAAVQKAEQMLGPIVKAAAAPANEPVLRFPDLLAEGKDALQSMSQATELVAAGQAKQLMLEVKVEFARLQMRCKTGMRKIKTALSELSSYHENTVSQSTAAVLDALRTAARRGEGGAYVPEELFTELASGSEMISEKQLSDFFATYGTGSQLSDEQVQLVMRLLVPHGLTRRAFDALLADYYSVARDIAITDDFEIQSAKKVRKLEVGELVEARGAVQIHETLGLERVMCFAVLDGASGWVTVRTKAGVSYLTSAPKPFLYCTQDVSLRRSADSETDCVRQLHAGEALELLQGPEHERLGSEKRLRGIACSDESSGWLQVQNSDGATMAEERNNMFKCTEAIAMTDVEDFDSCSMVRRVDVGEALELLPGSEANPDSGGTRMKFRACRDGLEGWVTTRGSQGKVYAQPVKRHFVCIQACPLHAGLGAESSVVRVLMPGEAFEAFEDPKEVTGGLKRDTYKVRAVRDGADGWVVAQSAGEILPWRKTYKVLKTVPLTKSQPANEAAEVVEVVRVLEPDELVDVSEPPTEDRSSGQLRARCVAQKDQSAGWATVRDGLSSLHMRPLTEAELIEAKALTAAEDGGAAASTTPPLDKSGKGGGKSKTASKGKGRGQASNAPKRPFVEVKQEMEQSSWQRSSKRYRSS